MKLYTANPKAPTVTTPLIAAALTGQKVELVVVDAKFKQSAEWKKMNQTDGLPLLQTSEGCIQESSAMIKYFGALSGKLLGSTPLDRTQVDQWIAYTASTLAPCIHKVMTGIYGSGDIFKSEWEEASKDLKAYIKVLNTALESQKWLAGADMSFADLYVAGALQTCFQTVLDSGFRKAMKNITPWAEAVYALPEYVAVNGKVQLCAKPMKPVVVADKKEEKKTAPVVAAAPKPEKKEEKVKDNVESLPPTNFDLYSFKTFFVNHPDKKGEAVTEMYKMLDWEGWSFWRFEYDIYEGEGAKEHITNNLMNGFISRAEHTNKYTFGRHCVLGEEPNLQIIGCWLVRGQEVPDGLAKEHAQFEYYKTRKLDPRNVPADDKLVREYFGGEVGDVIDGLKAVTLKWQK